MTTRDTQQLLDLFLEEGPAVLPDRVLDAVREDIHRQRQRVVIGPWRFRTMRTYLAAAAVIAVVVIGGGVLWASRGFAPARPGATPQPPIASPQQVFFAVLPDGTASSSLIAGATYAMTNLKTHFQFTLPVTQQPSLVQANLFGDGSSLNLRPEAGGALTIHDDARLPNDLCHPTGVLIDAGATVDSWLRHSAPDMTVSPMHMLGTVRYWDIVLGPKCVVRDQPPKGDPTIWFQAGEHHRVYAIPVGGTALMAFTWGRGYRGDGDDILAQLNPLADKIVQSIKALPSN